MQSHFHKSKYKYSTKSDLHDWLRLNSPSLLCLNVRCNFYFFCFLNSHPSKRKVLKGAVTMTIIEELSAGSTPFPSLVPVENQAGEIT